jgi:hypothetical protein
MLTTPGLLTQPNQVSLSSDPSVLEIPKATESPSAAPFTVTFSVLHELPSSPGKSSDAVVDICCVIGVPPPIVTAPEGDTWNCPAVPTANGAVSELLPMEKLPLGNSVTRAAPLFANKLTG